MNGFDLAIVAVIALSALFALARGIIREVLALATWVLGFVLAIAYSDTLSGLFSWVDIAPVGRHALAFLLILIVVMIAGAILARSLAGVIRTIGLGFVDRMLGAIFGVARGLIVMVAFALVAGVTTLPKQDWWQNSTLGPPLADAALALKSYLPKAWSDRLDFSPAGSASAGLGDYRTCAES